MLVISLVKVDQISDFLAFIGSSLKVFPPIYEKSFLENSALTRKKYMLHSLLPALFRCSQCLKYWFIKSQVLSSQMQTAAGKEDFVPDSELLISILFDICLRC